MINGKRILVSGACGFIGSHIVDVLVNENLVVGIDDLSSGNIFNIEKRRHKNFIFKKIDIREYTSIKDLFKKYDFEFVFHEAATNLLKSTENPRMDLEVNAIGTLNILEAMKKYSTKLIHASTGSVYGEPCYSPQNEDHPQVPTSPYGVSKLAAEKYCLAYKSLYGIEFSILRYYNVYGPKQRSGTHGGVIPVFLENAFKGKSIFIDGNGNQKRCFTYVSDIVEANVLAASKEYWGEIFNVASEDIITINQLALTLIELSRKEVEIVHRESRKGEIMEFHPDISKAKQMLGYMPKVNFKEGLRKTVEWYASERR
jgi:UDP-glucose 4-epimerase